MMIVGVSWWLSEFKLNKALVAPVLNERKGKIFFESILFV